MDEKMISVVIPMYNASKTIRRCLDSIITQDYKEIEVVIINDGSRDNSAYLCENYIQKDKRIKLYNFENHGVSWARNKGMEIANGRKIIFIDSDDRMKKNMLSILNEQSNAADIVICGINVINAQNRVAYQLNLTPGLLSVKEYFALLDEGQMNPFFGGTYNKLFDLEILRKNEIRFKENQSVAEDLCFNLEVLRHSKNVYIVEQYLYEYYLSGEESLSKRNYSKMDNEIFFQQCLVTYNEYELVSEKFDGQGKKLIQYQLWKMFVSKVNHDKRLTIMQKVNFICDKIDYYPKFSNIKEIKALTVKQKITACLLANRVGLLIISVILKIRYI